MARRLLATREDLKEDRSGKTMAWTLDTSLTTSNFLVTEVPWRSMTATLHIYGRVSFQHTNHPPKRVGTGCS